MARAVIYIDDQPDGSVLVDCRLTPDGGSDAEGTPGQVQFHKFVRRLLSFEGAKVEADYLEGADRVSRSVEV